MGYHPKIYSHEELREQQQTRLQHDHYQVQAMLRKLLTSVLAVDAIVGKLSSNARIWDESHPSGVDLRNLVANVLPAGATPPPDPNVPTVAGVLTTSPVEVPSEPPYAGKPIFETPIYYSPSSPDFKQANFEMQCRDTLLSGATTWDGLISQTDYAAFLTKYCISESTCNPAEPLQFQTLSTSLQAAFTDPLCSADGSLCAVAPGQDFGYVYNKDTKYVVKGQIRDMCDSLFPLLGSIVAPTSAPSVTIQHPTIEPVYVSPVYQPPKSPVFVPPKSPVFVPPKAPVYGGPLDTHRPSNAPNSPTMAPGSPTVTPNSPVFEEVSNHPSLAPAAKPVASEVPILSGAPLTSNPTTLAPYSSSTSAPTHQPTSAAPVSTSPAVVTTSPTKSPVVETTEPTTSPVVSTTPTKSPVRVTPSPSWSPSSMPSSAAAVVFVNEVGITNEVEFVEVVYSSTLEARITNYSVYWYSDEGSVLDETNLLEGNFSTNGMTFTFVTYPGTSATVGAFALVDTTQQDVLSFLSNGNSVLATEGPAAGMESTDVLKLLGRRMRRKLEDQGTNSTVGSSLSLVGTGCRFEDFAFAETTATPGTINSGQQILGCRNAAPSSSPSIQIGGNNGISVGAIIGISVGLGLLLFVMISLVSGRRSGDAKALVEEETLVFDHPKRDLAIPAVDDLMADTGDVEEDIPAPDADAGRLDSWWNSVYWMGGVVGVVGTDSSKGAKSTGEGDEGASHEDQSLDEDDIADTAAAVGPAAASTTPTARRGWFFRRGTKETTQPSDGKDGDLSPDDEVPSADPATMSQMDDKSDLNELQLTAAEGTSETPEIVGRVEPEEMSTEIGGVVVAAAVGGAVASTSKRKRRGWLPMRGAKKGPKPPEEGDSQLGDVGQSPDVDVPIVTTPALKPKDAPSIALARKDEDSDLDEIPLSSAERSDEADVSDLQASSVQAGLGPVEGGLVVGASSAVASAKKKKKRGWLFPRSAKKTARHSNDEPLPSDGPTLNADVPQATPPTYDTSDAGSIALSRDDESDVDLMSLRSAEVTSQALDNLDDALGKHDWSAIYNIAKSVSKRGDPPTDTFKSLTAKDLAPVSSDVVSDYGSALSGSHENPADAAMTDTPALKDVVATPEKSDETVASEPSSAGWVGYFRRKKGSQQGDSDSMSSPGLKQKSVDSQVGGRSTSSTGRYEDDEDLVAGALAKSKPSPAGAHFEAFERERKHAPGDIDSGSKPPEAEDRPSTMAKSIQKISSELQDEAQGSASSPSAPSLANVAAEAKIAKLIDSKDWKGLGDYSVQEEVVNERELQSIQARTTNLEAEEETLARLQVPRELDAAMLAFESNDETEQYLDEEANKSEESDGK